VWGRESNYKIPYKLMVIKKMMSALPCSKIERVIKKKEKADKKQREKEKYIYDKKKEKKREEDSPISYLCCLPPRPMAHTH